MSAETNKVLVQQYLDALRKDKSAATLDTYMTDQNLKHHIAMYDAVIPGYWLEAEQIIAEGDLVNVRGMGYGVHNGAFGELPPTGKEVAFPFFITYRIADGKIAEHWLLADMLTFLQQIGGMPVPAQA
jgi:predicted ester cyclase